MFFFILTPNNNMKPISLFFLLSISSLLLSSTPLSHATSSPNCSASQCTENGLKIRFPFYLSDPTLCGYPGFQLSCNKNNKTILTLPNSGHFLVTRIDYKKQSIYLNDPNHCLPNRILKNINLTGSPFRPAYLKKFIFYNCPTSKLKDYVLYRVIRCLGKNYTSTSSKHTIVVTDEYYEHFIGCTKIKKVSVPLDKSVYRYNDWMDLSEDLMLTWRDPSCWACEVAGGKCGLKNDGTNEVKCFDVPNRLSRNAKYAITMGIGVPGLICLIGFLCYTCAKLQSHGPNHQIGQTVTPQPAHIIMGLDGPTINSYPKTILGDSGRLPKPNEGTCSICLAEYLPKEILRSIPECNHYFHANCVDEWLKMNATCPLCRKSPSGSLAETPSSSLSLSSSASSL